MSSETKNLIEQIAQNEERILTSQTEYIDNKISETKDYIDAKIDDIEVNGSIDTAYVDEKIAETKEYVDSKMGEAKVEALSSNADLKTLVINDGIATGKYSVAGGTDDKSLVSDIVGTTGATFVDIETSKATGAMSVSYGAGNNAYSSASTAFGIKNQSGFLGYYIHRINTDTNQLYLSTKQSSHNKPTKDLSSWVGCTVTIINDSLYPECGVVSSISNVTENSTTYTVVTLDRELPFDTLQSSSLTDLPHDRSIIAIPPVGSKTILGKTFETYRPTAVGEVELGFSSTAFGFDNIAAGTLSTTFGYRNTALGTASFVTGRENTGSFASLVGGYKNEATGQASTATGAYNKATGSYASAQGFRTEATGIGSHTEGMGNENGIVVGYDGVYFNGHNIASGNGSHAEGRATKALDSGSHAEGVLTLSIGEGAHTEGKLTAAYGTASHAEGIGSAEGFAIKLHRNETYPEAYTIDVLYGNVNLKEGKNIYFQNGGLATVESVSVEEINGNPVTLIYLNNLEDRNEQIGFSDSSGAVGEASHVEGKYTHARGIAAHAEGTSTEANGYYSHAEGHSAKAYGECSHAEGFDTLAENKYTHAEGYKTQATGSRAHAEGDKTTAAGDYSHAEGYSKIKQEVFVDKTNEEIIEIHTTNDDSNKFSYAGGAQSHVEGSNSLALGASAHAEGNRTIADGDYSHAEGRSARASGMGSHAEGKETTASGENAHAEGFSTKASGNYSHAEGSVTTASAESAHAEGSETVASGKYSHAEGFRTTASGGRAHAEGHNTKAEGHFSHAEGQNTTVTTTGAHAEGYKTKAGGDKYATDSEDKYIGVDGKTLEDQTDESLRVKIGQYSHAEGAETIATGYGAHAEGAPGEYDATVSDVYGTHGEKGNIAYNTATGYGAHAEGAGTTASGEGAHAEGVTYIGNRSSISSTSNYTIYTTASGRGAHAEGVGTGAHAEGAHAEGVNTTVGFYIDPTKFTINDDGTFTYNGKTYTAEELGNIISSGNGAHAEGVGTIANGMAQHVQGLYNIEDNENKYAHIVGNGYTEWDDTRKPSNAHTLDWQGNAWFKGDVYVGNTSQDDGNRLVEAKYTVPQKYITNLITEENITYNGMYGTDGYWVTRHGDKYSTVKIECKPGDKLYVYYNGEQYPGLSRIFCNMNDSHHSDITNAEYNNGRVTGNGTKGNLIEVPSNNDIVCVYLAFETAKIANSAVYKSDVAIEWKVPDGESVVIEDKITHWSGKKWYAYGTSITDTGTIANTGKYTNILASLSGMELVNKGIGSQGIADFTIGGYEGDPEDQEDGNQGGVRNALLDNTDGKSEADLITIEVGANDVGVVAAGNLGNYYDNIADVDTFCSRLNQCLKHLQETTNAQILVVGSPFAADENPKNKYELFKATEECCRYNGVQYLYPNCNLGSARLTATNKKYLVRDHTKIHQSGLGGYIYASHIWEKLKTMPLFY